MGFKFSEVQLIGGHFTFQHAGATKDRQLLVEHHTVPLVSSSCTMNMPLHLFENLSINVFAGEQLQSQERVFLT